MASDDGWEARMAERSKARREAARKLELEEQESVWAESEKLMADTQDYADGTYDWFSGYRNVFIMFDRWIEYWSFTQEERDNIEKFHKHLENHGCGKPGRGGFRYCSVAMDLFALQPESYKVLIA